MYDAVVIGGGAAGLSAALVLGRARRSLLILDAGTPRNSPAEYAHGFLSRDGIPPLELLQIGREDLLAYGNVEFKAAEIAGAAPVARGFSLSTAEGREIEARRLVLATGVVDVLPGIPGVVDLWGHGVYHCPYCHGWEVRDRPWAILGDGFTALEQSTLFAGWASKLVVLTNGSSSLSGEQRRRLAGQDVALDERRIAEVRRAGGAGDVVVRFEDASSLTVGAVFVLPRQVQRSALVEALACETYGFEPTASRYVKTDAVTGETSVAGVYAAGDMIGPQQSLVLAAASGARAAYALNRALAVEDAEAKANRVGAA